MASILCSSPNFFSSAYGYQFLEHCVCAEAGYGHAMWLQDVGFSCYKLDNSGICFGFCITSKLSKAGKNNACGFLDFHLSHGAHCFFSG